MHGFVAGGGGAGEDVVAGGSVTIEAPGWSSGAWAAELRCGGKAAGFGA